VAEPGRTGPVGIGIVGAGTISGEYLRNLTRFPDTRVVAIGDLRPEAAHARAAEFGIEVAGSPDLVYDHPDVEIVVNLTIPAAHAEVARRAIAAGRHVWNEKPLAADPAAARAVLAAADAAGVRVGCAPDTFLGDGLQAARAAIDAGVIGEPLTALALMQSPGPDRWHPDPAFLFQAGAGPLFDIGPYHLTALVLLLGPIERAAALASTARATRVIGAGPRAGETFAVTTPSHVGALVGFAGGRSAQLVLSFDSPQPRVLLEVTGTEATLLVPDPNTFDGEILVRRADDAAATVYAATRARSTRGTGVLDLARAIREGRPHRASGALALHVLDAMAAILESAAMGAFVAVAAGPDRAEALPADWDPAAPTLCG
jgi:predicted dehydrogenase